MNEQVKKRALGRGLGALLPGAGTGAYGGVPPVATPPKPAAMPAQPLTVAAKPETGYQRVAIEDIYPSPEQPRKRFAEEELLELSQSITAHGIIQPLIVRKKPDGTGFFLIAGERRWRASQKAGLTEVPVVVQDVTSRDAFERALVENIQRSDLNAIEEAEAYSRLMSEHGYTQEQVAERVGKERSTVANSLRLLKLPEGVREQVETGALSMGHARALLSLSNSHDIETMARQVVAQGLSVRATEALVKKKLSGPADAGADKKEKSTFVRDLEERLTKSLGSPVAMSEDKQGKSGRIEIRYANLDDLDRLLARLFGN
jgi:ParB family chromosome partitioning protein